MPLESGTSNKTIAHNAGVELKHHRPRKQAWAIAYAYARRHPDGGKPPPKPKHPDHKES
jgi:hypothetical protein